MGLPEPSRMRSSNNFCMKPASNMAPPSIDEVIPSFTTGPDQLNLKAAGLHMVNLRAQDFHVSGFKWFILRQNLRSES